VQLEISRDFRHKGSTTEPLETLGGVKSPQLAGLSATSEENSLKRRMDGWGGRIRTSAWWNQNPLPYHLATPQQAVWKAAGPACRGSLWQRRSIEGVEPFQPAGSEISPGTKSPNSGLDIRLFPFDRSPFPASISGCLSPIDLSRRARRRGFLRAKCMAFRAIPLTGELREWRFRGKT
jgi:hypothetical protein